MASQYFIGGVAKNLNINTFMPPYRDIYFAGWSTEPMGEVIYTNGDEFATSRNITLYAVWKVVVRN